MAQLASAPGLGPGSRRFKSFRPDFAKALCNKGLRKDWFININPDSIYDNPLFILK